MYKIYEKHNGSIAETSIIVKADKTVCTNSNAKQTFATLKGAEKALALIKSKFPNQEFLIQDIDSATNDCRDQGQASFMQYNLAKIDNSGIDVIEEYVELVSKMSTLKDKQALIVEQCDKETLDILHLLEDEDITFNVFDAWAMFNNLRDLRIKRRHAKITLSSLKEITDSNPLKVPTCHLTQKKYRFRSEFGKKFYFKRKETLDALKEKCKKRG